ncbi:MAG: serine/threonine-protein phosphatase [Candidatus Riflebacteria bacterium]|nr:serine/threonine-protein phosphatase [Candidatus Riflebacteria bacterium]
MSDKSARLRANNTRLLLSSLGLLAIVLLAVLVPYHAWALPTIFIVVILFFTFLRRQIISRSSADDVCDFYAQVHSIENLQILQNERPYSTLLKTVLELGQFDWAVMFLMDFEKDSFVAVEAAGIELSRFSSVDFDEIATDPRVDDMTLSYKLLEHAFKKHEFRGALAGTTLVCNNTFYGCLLVGRDDPEDELCEDDNFRLEILSDQISICLHNYRLHKEMASRTAELLERQAQIQRELEMSRIVQEGVMQRETPMLRGLELAAYSRPARFIGGDFVRYIEESGKNQLGILIGDVSGKGIPAAMVMAVVVCLFNEKSSLEIAPDKLLIDMNIALKQFLGARSRFNSSALWGIFDLDRMRFCYASAGHDFPLHINCKTRQVTELVSTGTLLGLFAESEYQSREILIEEGDKIMFYSDGLVDFFEYNLGFADGFAGLKDFFLERFAKTPQEIVNEITELVEITKEPTKDDITVAVFSIARKT